MHGLRFRKILADLEDSGQQRVQSLETLLNVLISRAPGLSKTAPIPQICLSLTAVLDEATDDLTSTLAFRCIGALLPGHNAANLFFLKYGILQKINSFLNLTHSADAARAAFHIISFVAETKPGKVLEDISPSHYFRFLPLLSRVEQRECLQIIRKVTGCGVGAAWSCYVPTVLQLMEGDDEVVRGLAAAIFGALAAAIEPLLVRMELIRSMISILNKGMDDVSVRVLSGTLVNMCKNGDVVREMLVTPVRFEELLGKFDDEEIVENLLKLIVLVFPVPQLPRDLWEFKSVERNDGEKFVEMVLPLAFEVLKRCASEENLNLAVAIVAASVTIVDVEVPKEVLHRLLDLAKDSVNVPYIIVIAEKIQDAEVLYSSGIVSVLLKMKVPSRHKEWVNAKLVGLKHATAKFHRRVPKEVLNACDLRVIVDFLTREHVQPFEFWDSSLPTRCVQLMANMKRGECGDVRVLVELCNAIMKYCNLSKVRHQKSKALFRKRTVKFMLKDVPGEIAVPLVSSFLILEGWYNIVHNNGIQERLKSSISDNPLLMSMVDVDTELTKSYSKFALFCRAFQTDGYIRCSFKSGSHQFSVFDSIPYAISLICRETGEIPDAFHLEVVEADIPRAMFDVQPFKMAKYVSVLTLLKHIARCAPEQFHIDESFQNFVFSRLADPWKTVTLMAPAVRMMYAFKELFPFEQRLFLFRCTSLDPSQAVKLVHDQFWKEAGQYKSHIPMIPCAIKREFLFEHGCFIISRVCPGRVRTKFRFDGEPGFGEGVLQEFFTCISREFCRRSLRMWRDNMLFDSEYVIFEDGLFPAVTADPSLMEILGYICGKALLMNKLVNIPLHPMFFKMVLGEHVEVSDIDPIFARSLLNSEGLYDLPFLYPGTNIELKPNGKDIFVDETNVEEFVALVKSFTCGEVMMKKVQFFVKSFETIVYKDALRLFSYEEMVKILSGDEVHITIDELRRYVRLEHGYDENSREIADLFEVIEEMSASEQTLFTMFVTGCRRLPYGGLASLRPPLTVARRATSEARQDQCLPSVMTCTNYFKMPPYSCKSVMRAKIMQAITECQETFQFS